jgi:hypothetical protein
MHLRGKDMKITAEFPSGERKVLLDVPRYDFNWQMVYEFNAPVPAPKGTKILVDAHFDNSKNNPDNPDPSVTVVPGQPTTAEMMIGWMHFTLDEENIHEGRMIDYQRRRGGRGGSIDLANVVKTFDRNEDGKLDKEEAPEQLKNFFTLIDVDADGFITLQEAQAAQGQFQARREERAGSAGR